MAKECKLCGATFARRWAQCAVCGGDLCEDCGVHCDKCGKIYCNTAACGMPVDDEEEENYCKKCKK